MPTTNIFVGILESIEFSGQENTQICTIKGRDYTARLMDVTVEPSIYTNSEISTICKLTSIFLTNFLSNFFIILSFKGDKDIR